MIKNINHWILNRINPMFNDVESLSLLDLVGRLTAKMNELINGYNEFGEEVKTEFEGLREDVVLELQSYEVSSNQKIKDFTDVVTLRMDNSDIKVEEAVQFMKGSIEETTTGIITDMMESGALKIGVTYNPETEELIIGSTTGGV